jgi:hypothetical protein
MRAGVAWGALAIAGGLAGVAGAAMITISTAEQWYGNTIHGLTPSGAGTQASPYVYAIADGLTITSTGLLQFDPNPTDAQGATIAPWVTLDFSASSAGLHIDSGGRIDTSIGARNQLRGLALNLGANSLTGSGAVYNSNVARQDGSMRLTLQGGSTANVTLGNLDNHVNDPNGGSNSVSITVGGAVAVASINTSDTAAGGGAAGSVTIRAGSIVIPNGIQTFAGRTGSAVNNGNITLEALAYPGFDANDGVNNTHLNTLTLGGLLDTEGSTSLNQGGGDITLRAVVVTLNPSFTIDKEADALLAIYAGIEPPFTGQHFFDNSTDPTSYSATFNVLHVPIPEPAAALLLAAACLAARRRGRASDRRAAC